MELRALQDALAERFAAMDRQAGLPFLVSVLQEEVGELARAVRKGEAQRAGDEACDVLFMALSICNVLGQDAEQQVRAKFLERPLADVTRTWEDVPRR
ncbi:MAG TPA: MazG nucleotide pyrophosphohydrolase domain-containing protein [Candidatus Thermoplasmatota archaeon]|jgi:NTP pyrophosphatase (non-canonical NTP hydrolase)|nr:MazG nucleotide pyrophosphohydrolase domain-containing protein [Candidatus Thermoplasmatota archaeon]